MASKLGLEPLVRSARFKPEQKSAARNIDTYVKPQEKYIAPPQGKSGAESLAYALRETSPILTKYFKDRELKQQQELIAEGERLKKESNLKTWAEAIREHPEYEKYSPYLREGFEKQRAIALGVEYNHYMTELSTTDQQLAQIQDPAEANAYLQQKGAEWIKANTADINDRAIQQYLLPAVNEYNKYHTSQMTETRLDELVQAKRDTFQTALSMMTEDSLLLGESPEKIGDGIGSYISQTILDGTNPSETNTAAIDSLLNLMQRKANEGDMKTATGIKAVLENIKGRDGAPLAKIMRYRTVIDTAWTKVGDEAFQQIARDRQLKAWEKDDALQEVRDKYGADIWQAPTADRTKLLAQVAKEYGSEVAKAFSNDIKEALSYQRQRKAYKENLSGGEAGRNKQIKDTLIALSYTRPLTDEESMILASTGATIPQVMNARQGKNVQDDGSYKLAGDVAKKILRIPEKDWGELQYSQYQQVKGELLTAWKDYATDFHSEHGRVPSKREKVDFFDNLLIKRLKQQNEASQDKAAEREKEDKIQKVINKNNDSSLFKSLPKITPKMLQLIIDEEKREQKQ